MPSPEDVVRAVEFGREGDLRRLLRAGADADAVDAKGNPLICIAAYDGEFDIVDILAEAGADLGQVDAEGRSALMIAAGQGHMSVVQALLDRGQDFSADPKARARLVANAVAVDYPGVCPEPEPEPVTAPDEATATPEPTP